MAANVLMPPLPCGFHFILSIAASSWLLSDVKDCSAPMLLPARTSESGTVYIDYKDTESLRKMISGNGKIQSRKRTGATAITAVENAAWAAARLLLRLRWGLGLLLLRSAAGAAERTAAAVDAAYSAPAAIGAAELALLAAAAITP